MQVARGARREPRPDLHPALVGSTFDAETLRAPAQHPAREVRDLLKAGLAEEHGRLRRARARAANDDDWFFSTEDRLSLEERTQGNQHRTRHMPERAVDLV